MKLKPLDRIIKSHYKRCCPFCQNNLIKEVVKTTGKRRKHIKVLSRNFECKTCNVHFVYDRVGNHFEIVKFIYNLDNYVIICNYAEKNYTISKKEKPIGYVWKSPLVEISTIDGVIPFNNKEKFELQIKEKIQIYETFS